MEVQDENKQKIVVLAVADSTKGYRESIKSTIDVCVSQSVLYAYGLGFYGCCLVLKKHMGTLGACQH